VLLVLELLQMVQLLFIGSAVAGMCTLNMKHRTRYQPGVTTQPMGENAK
jgi:hypothetical protein